MFDGRLLFSCPHLATPPTDGLCASAVGGKGGGGDGGGGARRAAGL